MRLKRVWVAHTFLTSRELDIIRGIYAGQSNREIARSLSLAEKTVKNYISDALTKTGLPTRTRLAFFAFDHGLIDTPRPVDPSGVAAAVHPVWRWRRVGKPGARYPMQKWARSARRKPSR